VPEFRLVGGPCNGNTQFYYSRPLVGTVLPCGFHDYVFNADGTFHDAGLTGSSGTSRAEAFGPSGHNGWVDLQRSVNRKLPTSISRSQGIRRAAVRLLAKQQRHR